MIVLLQTFMDVQLVIIGGMYIQLGSTGSPERSHILIYISEDDAHLPRRRPWSREKEDMPRGRGTCSLLVCIRAMTKASRRGECYSFIGSPVAPNRKHFHPPTIYITYRTIDVHRT